MFRSVSSLGIEKSVGMVRSLGRVTLVGRSLSSAVSSDRSVGTAVTEAFPPVLPAVVEERVDVLDPPDTGLDVSAAEFACADPLTAFPQAATVRMVAAARAKAAAMAKRDFMFTPAGAARMGRWIVAVRRLRGRGLIRRAVRVVVELNGVTHTSARRGLVTSGVGIHRPGVSVVEAGDCRHVALGESEVEDIEVRGEPGGAG